MITPFTLDTMEELQRRVDRLEAERDSMLTLINTLLDRANQPVGTLARVHPEPPTVPPVPPDVRDLRVLANIEQNVHTTEVNTFGKTIFEALWNHPQFVPDDFRTFCYDLLGSGLHTFLHNKYIQLNPQTSSFKRFVFKYMLNYKAGMTIEKYSYSRGSVYNVLCKRHNQLENFTLREIIETSFYICNILNNNDLWNRVLQELEDGYDYCAVGVAARLMNAFSGFEHLIGLRDRVDPRSLSERLGDLFSALSKKDSLTLEQKILEANTILTQNNVTDPDHRTAWIDALS